MKETFDVCIIVLNQLYNDARALNLARTFANNNYSVAVVVLADVIEQSKTLSEKFKVIQVPVSDYKRALFRILEFRKKTRKINIHAQKYVAEDLYSLETVIHLAKKFDGRVIYDSREIFSALGPLYKNKLKQYLLAFWEKRLVKNVYKFIVSGEMDAKYLKNYFNTSVPFSVVMNLPPYKPVVHTDLIREKFNIPSQMKILIYQGMINPGRGLIPVLKALEYCEDTVLCIFGEGNFRQEVVSEAEKLGLSGRLFFGGMVDYDKLHEYTCSADVGIVFIEPVSLSYRLALPNKLFEYCMAGIPSLVSDLPAMRKIIEKEPIGKMISAGSSAEQIAAAIKELIRDKKIYGTACSEAAKKFCYESQVTEIINLLN